MGVKNASITRQIKPFWTYHKPFVRPAESEIIFEDTKEPDPPLDLK